jgi:ABC-2 type transport system permease protein
MNVLAEGLVDSRPLVYYLSFSVLLLSLTHHVLESRKWRA